MGMRPGITLKKYGDEWKRVRRVFHQNFGTSKVVEFRSIEERQVRFILSGLLKSPENFFENLKV